MRGLSGVGKVDGNIALFSLAIAVGCVNVRLHAHQIHHAIKTFLRPKGKMNRDGGSAEEGLHALERAVETRPLAIEFIDDDSSWKLEVLAERPDLFGLHFDSSHAVYQY